MIQSILSNVLVIPLVTVVDGVRFWFFQIKVLVSRCQITALNPVLGTTAHLTPRSLNASVYVHRHRAMVIDKHKSIRPIGVCHVKKSWTFRTRKQWGGARGLASVCTCVHPHAWYVTGPTLAFLYQLKAIQSVNAAYTYELNGVLALHHTEVRAQIEKIQLCRVNWFLMAEISEVWLIMAIRHN